MDLNSLCQIVFCGLFSPKQYRTVEECRECEHHRDVEEVVPAQNGQSAIYDIICGLPVRLRIGNLVSVTDKEEVI